MYFGPYKFYLKREDRKRGKEIAGEGEEMARQKRRQENLFIFRLTQEGNVHIGQSALGGY